MGGADNAGVLRPAQRGQKHRVEQNGKCWLDPYFQYEYGLRKQGLSIHLPLGVLSKRCHKSVLFLSYFSYCTLDSVRYHRQHRRTHFSIGCLFFLCVPLCSLAKEKEEEEDEEENKKEEGKVEERRI